MSDSFEQPADPVVSQEEQETQSNLQETPSNGINYGSTEWARGLKPALARAEEDPQEQSLHTGVKAAACKTLELTSILFFQEKWQMKVFALQRNGVIEWQDQHSVVG